MAVQGISGSTLPRLAESGRARSVMASGRRSETAKKVHCMERQPLWAPCWRGEAVGVVIVPASMEI